MPMPPKDVDATTNLSAGLRGFLYLTAAVCGAAVLIVEILGAKMLAPYFGTSHFVWTAQIAITLVSLSAGYYVGGWLVDRSASLSLMYACILGAAAYLCLSTRLCRPICESCLDLNLALGSLLASAFLFLVPLALLAMVAPFLVRVMTRSLHIVGKQVGRLSGISTIGSVAGTILIGYCLIPYFPNSTTMLCTAGTLAALAIVYAVVWARRARRPLTTVSLAIGGVGLLVLGPEAPGNSATYTEMARANSNFGLLQVMRVQGTAYNLLLNDNLSQNAYDTQAKQSVHAFTYMLHELARGYTPKISDALCIGMGVGIVPMQFARSGVSVDVVEINPAVIPLAQRYFDFDPSRIRLFIDDGRHFLNRCPNRYDTILLDAFLGDSSPSHLMTQEAFQAMRAILRPGGTLVINSFGDLRTGDDYYACSLYKTLRSVFQCVKVHAAREFGNVYYVASDQAQLAVVHEPDLASVHAEVIETVTAALHAEARLDKDHGIVLTDDFNPIDFYDARNRERLRRSLSADR
jgi:spermidine synthase